MTLPIRDLESELTARLRAGRRLVLSAPTGSGKSTQVPQMLLRHGLLEKGECVVLQPRRIAARLLAARVAEELGVTLGQEVGYQIRFENVTSKATKIRFVTEGVLLRRMIRDPKLKDVAVLVFDEFHERHLFGDITLARALDLEQKIIVMSATLDTEGVAEYLKPCDVLTSEGRQYPVTIEYAGGDAPVWERTADAFRPDGDTLVFMPGAYEINRTIETLRRKTKGHLILPLHGELGNRDQDAAVARYDKPKIVVSTNVAETSLTIDGITTVIDSGLARIARHDPYRGINTLMIEKISRASADQRAGRAGRTAPGRCVRLWPEKEHRAAREIPEVKRLDLSEILLTLKASGIDDLRWFEPPDPKALAHAEELLTDLGALKRGTITDLGRRMLAFPVHPRYSRMLLSAQEFGCVREAAMVAAITQGKVPRIHEKERGTSDFHVLMKQHRGGRVFEQFMKIAKREGLDPSSSDDDAALRKCILIGFSDRVAKRLDGGTLRCALVHGRGGDLARESVVRKAPLLVAAEVREIEGKGVKTLLGLATAIEPAWLSELFPEDMNEGLRVWYEGKTVFAEKQQRFRDLVLESRRVDPPADEAARLLTEEILAGRLKLKNWTHAVDQWIERLNTLARACPELELPPIMEKDRRDIIEHLCHGKFAFKDVRDTDVMPAVKDWLSPAQQALVDRHAPERLKLANGKTPKITYGDEPFFALRIQELYGVKTIPPIALGKVAPRVHILAPNMRPVQITADLARFWKEHYPAVKKELQRKYHRHEWRDNP